MDNCPQLFICKFFLSLVPNRLVDVNMVYVEMGRVTMRGSGQFHAR